MQPISRSLRSGSVAATAALALLVTTAPAALAGGGDAEVTIDAYECTSIDVTSSKDLSNVVLEFTDGDRQRFEGLTSRTGTFAGSGDNAGDVITTAWIKSGANHSGDGPGYGERTDFDTSTCDDTGGQAGSTSEAPSRDGGASTKRGDSSDDRPDTQRTDAEGTAPGGAGAQVTATHDCTSIDVTSSKDLSNVVLEFTDGDRQRFEGLTSRTGTFAGSGENAGDVITTAWVKSGANHSGDGPGYGERTDFDTSTCDDTDSGTNDSGTTNTDTTDTGTSTTGTTDTGTTDTGSTDTGTTDTGTTDTGSTDTDTGTSTTGTTDDDTDTIAGTEDATAEVATRDVQSDLAQRTDDRAPAIETSVLGSTDERGVDAAAATGVRSADDLPVTGADALAALFAALGALGLGTGLVRRTRRR